MVRYDITIHTTAKRELQDLEPQDRERLTDVIADVAAHKEPTAHEKVRPLEGQSGLFRVRVGDVRAVLELAKPELRTLTVGKRDSVYRAIDTIHERREATA